MVAAICLAVFPVAAHAKEDDLSDLEASVREESAAAPPSPSATQEPRLNELRREDPKPVPRDKLVPLEEERLSSGVTFLEKRVAQLERNQRFQEDRIRRLDRLVEDLKRRHG